MSRRIIGQCSITDFREIEKLAGHITDAETLKFRLSALTKTQNVAISVIAHFQACHVPFSVLFKVKEVLVWEMNDGKDDLAFEYKLLNPKDRETAQIIMVMHQKETK